MKPVIVLFCRCIVTSIFPDLDCKLKSAAQTPATQHNILHNNVPEILGRPVNDAQIYYNAVSLSSFATSFFSWFSSFILSLLCGVPFIVREKSL